MSPTPVPRLRVRAQRHSRFEVPSDRRQHVRFSVALPAEYETESFRGSAVTCNLSSGGLFFRTDRELAVGSRVRLFVDWPAVLDGHVALRLVVDGRVLRSSRRGSAMRIAHHEFRVHARRPAAAGV